MSTSIANRFKHAFPGATFEVRQPDVQNDSRYEIDVANGPLDWSDVGNFEVGCHVLGLDVTVND